MQVQLGQKFTHFFATPFKEGQNAADEALFHSPDAGPLDGNGAIAQGELAGLAEAIAIAVLGINRRSALAACPS
jgi:hypothetical protein